MLCHFFLTSNLFVSIQWLISKPWKIEYWAVVASLLAWFHCTNLYVSKISRWWHMLTSYPFAACRHGLLYSDANSTICSLTAQKPDDMCTTDKYIISMKHLHFSTWIFTKSNGELTWHTVTGESRNLTG